MFEKTLTDIVKGIRAQKRDTALYISQCIAEIKTEINSKDMHVKANALQKLTFLQMMGYGMTWASFATIEVMSSPRLAHKRIGYLAASQGFTQDTEVILLTTNLLKKELRSATSAGNMNSSGIYETGLAINCVSNIVTEELSKDLLPELTNLLSHPQPYLRKKAILCLFKVFVKYPQALRLTFAKLQQCLSDSNPSVVSCAVNVITELSDKNPKNYLHLAPAFFDLLTTSNNNWMLIKVVKLLGSLVPEEPRLARKLLEPLAAIVRNTPAKSLLYEAVHAITLCLPYCRKADGSMPPIVPDIVTLCAKTLREFVEEKDQNLKYLGLVGFGSLMQSHPKILTAADYRPLILACLSDEDVTIRTRALDLLTGMASRKNLMELITQLLRHVEMASGSYKLDLVAKIVQMCSSDKYSLIQDFAWYLDVLFQLGHMRGLDVHANLLASQITDVALRVLPVRGYAVRRSMEILLEGSDAQDDDDNNNNNMNNNNRKNQLPSSDPFGDNGRGKHIMPEILPSIAWIIGEYSDLFPEAVTMDMQDTISSTTSNRGQVVFIYNNDSEGPYHSIIQAITDPTKKVMSLPSNTHKVLVQASMKVFAACVANAQVADIEIEACANTLSRHLPVYMQSPAADVQERACMAYTMMDSLNLLSRTATFVNDTVPKLATVNDSEDSSDDDNNDDGNLLGIMGAAATKKKSKSSSQNSSIPLSSSSSDGVALAVHCRNASQVLNYTYKPSPMKPSSAKAQRKKQQQAPTGVIGGPLNISIFSALIEQEANTADLTMEAVSFTQQKPLSKRQNEPIGLDGIGSGDMGSFPSSSSTPMVGIGGGGGGIGGMSTGGFSDFPGTSTGSFQNAPMSDQSPAERTTFNNPRAQTDPFYLNSQPTPSPTTDTGMANRFGTIQLDANDSDDDDDDNNNNDNDGAKKKSKKKKKHKKERKLQSTSASGANPMGFPPMMGQPGVGIGIGGGAAVTIYDSDENDDGDDVVQQQPSRRGRKGGNKEFSGLAKVDLTMPLREDEVMPERKHRVVPDRKPEQAQQDQQASDKRSSKKKKKEAKKARKAAKKDGYAMNTAQPAPTSAAPPPSAAAGGIGDLLDLGGFVPTGQPMATPSNSISLGAPTATNLTAPIADQGLVMSNQGSAVNKAFDDLLGFSTAPASAPTSAPAATQFGMMAPQPSPPPMASSTIQPSPTVSSSSSSSSKGGKRPWMKGTIKTSNASGSPVVDWSKVSLLYRVYKSSGDGTAASIVVRVDNHMEMSPLNGLTLQLKDFGQVPIGNISPCSFVESSKIGPFTYTQHDEPLDMKGTLVTSDCSVPVKFYLPVSMHLQPLEGLTMDVVAQQLANGSMGWTSHSAKVEITGNTPIDKIKPMLCNFLRVAEINNNGGGSAATVDGTFAAQSAQGVQVRILAKVKKDVVKIDVKSSNGSSLAKAIVSDLKKLVF